MASSLIRFENQGQAKKLDLQSFDDTANQLDRNEGFSQQTNVLPHATKLAQSILKDNQRDGDQCAPPDTTPNELELSNLPSSDAKTVETAKVMSTWNSPPMNKWRILSACLILLGNGMNDSAPGALLPYIEQYYHVNYAVVSTIFIANAAGFILAAFFVHALDARLGRAKTVMLCEAIVIVGYVMMSVTPPFPVFVIGYFVNGYGIATSLALNNVFGANITPSTVVLGIMHGSYGIGGLLAPIFATTMVTRGILFSRFYLITLGVRVVNFTFSGWTFWNFERDAKPDVGEDIRLQSMPQSDAEAHALVANKPGRIKALAEALKNRTTLFGALFIFAYQGAEVSISGWVISFLISYRDGNPAQVGYVTAGFWGGITMGRFALSPLAQRWGEKHFASALIALTIVFQLVLWLVPNVVASSVTTAIVGVLLGPIYPCTTTIMSRLLERRLQNTALAFISSAGSSGGAVAPFMVGLIAQGAGTWVLSPICIGLYAVMATCWIFLTWGYGRKRKE